MHIYVGREQEKKNEVCVLILFNVLEGLLYIELLKTEACKADSSQS